MIDISVIVPVFNAERYIDDCVKSVLNQTFTNWELVLVDDGSTDKSGEIIDNYAKKLDRITVIHQQNSGPGAARKEGGTQAKGKYIAFLDADDALPENALIDMFEASEKNNLDIVVTSARHIEQNKEEKIIENKISGQLSRVEYIASLLNADTSMGSVERLFKKTLFDSHTFDIPQTIRQNEDLIMNIHLAINAKQIAVFNNIIAYNYFRRANTLRNKLMTYDYWLQVFEIIEKILLENNLIDAVLSDFQHYKLRRVDEFTISRIYKTRKILAPNSLCKIKKTLKSIKNEKYNDWHKVLVHRVNIYYFLVFDKFILRKIKRIFTK